ncbi:cysteine desulfurase/selenocysteine lyase [Pontibacter ummariensis]|uniref:Probable cysteine desulfurase n=1 Tax=Pontibacter ummariensis TaxID=1610492 RepID=A0A239D591_9BACT|nr:cysteine desulfurase [Pontibacter ummariensis]PRY14232.1 cysteine desulfurase/selenocysteine lyase [Pontibacter ummariensis]SNS27004.1 cysteine desulfurase / selenocysteine lyase [Pontibacter ummariensis]
MSGNSSISTVRKLDIERLRSDFPILQTQVYGKPLVYLDNAATTQKPASVIKAMDDYYTEYNSNIHRGVHYLSQKATSEYELVRKKVQAFINAEHLHEVIFTRGTTEGINLVANSFGRKFLKAGDSIMISAMEHHSNIVPWQMACEDRGARLQVIPMNNKGELMMDAFEQMLDDTVKLVSVTYISNSLGTVNPLKEIIQAAHQKGIPVLVDAAQAIQHVPIDVQELDADFLAFSGHKMYGPTGIGVLYGKEEWLNQLPPYQGGGDMIKSVSFAKTTYNELPLKFEAGTPSIAEGMGLGAAIDYLEHLGLQSIAETEGQLFSYAVDALQEIDELRFIGEADNRAASISFLVGDTHPFDVGEILDKHGIAVRTGHHCTEPIMHYFGIPGTVRASIAFYNTTEEIDKLIAAVKKAVMLLR